MILWLYCNIIGYDDMATCYEGITVNGLKNVGILCSKVLEVEQREHGKI